MDKHNHTDIRMKGSAACYIAVIDAPGLRNMLSVVHASKFAKIRVDPARKKWTHRLLKEDDVHYERAT